MCLIKHQAMKKYGAGGRVRCLVAALERCESLLHVSAALPQPSLVSDEFRGPFPPVSIVTGELAGPQAGRNAVEKGKFSYPYRESNQIPLFPAGSPITTLTVLFRPIEFHNNVFLR